MLIFGFEAIIIGGLGSLWGTLAGGILLGLAQAIGGHINVGLPFVAGHVAFLAVLLVRPQGLFPKGMTMNAAIPAMRVSHTDLSTRIGMAFWLVLVLALAAAPYWGERQTLRLLTEVFSYVALASLWNLLAGYAGLVSVGQQAFVGIGGYTLYLCALWAGINPLLGMPIAGRDRRDRGDAHHPLAPQAARRLLHHRLLGHRRDIPADLPAGSGGRRRVGDQPSRRRGQGDRRHPRQAASRSSTGSSSPRRSPSSGSS